MRFPVTRRIAEALQGWLRRHWLMLPVALLYLWPFPYFEPLNSPNENVRLYMTIAMVDDGTYDIEPVCQRYWWVNDRSVVGGRAYSSKAPGASFAGVPFYAVAKGWAKLRGRPLERREMVWWLRFTVCVVPALVFLFFFRRFLGMLGPRPFVRDLVFLGYALGTPAYTYIHQFAGHVPSACALFGAFMLLAGARREGRWSAWRGAAFGFLLGWAPTMEYQALIPSMVVGAAFLLESRRSRPVVLLVALVAGAIPAGLMAHFHWVAFGSPLSTGYAYIENPAFQDMLSEGWMGLTYPRLDRLLQLTLSTDCGLLFFSPFLAFGLLVVLAPLLSAVEWDRHRIHLVAWSLGAVVTLLMFISANILWRAGWTAGPRYLTALMPFAALLALVGLTEADRVWGAPVRAVALASLLLSVFFSGVSGAIYPHFPVSFHNPIFEVLVPMLRDGFFPENAGYNLLGLSGAWGYVPALALGAAPCLGWLVWTMHRSAAVRASLLVTAALLAVLACQPFVERARRASMPQWGLEDVTGMYTAWQPVDNVTYFGRHGCRAEKSMWQLYCPDRVTQGRVKMRLGQKWLSALQYQGRGYFRAQTQQAPALQRVIRSK